MRERIAALALALLTPFGVAHAVTRADVHVLGTVVSSQADRSLAVVDDGGARRVVHVGDELAGATVVEIKSDALLVRRGGRVESLDLQSVSRAGAATGGPVPAAPAPGDSDALDTAVAARNAGRSGAASAAAAGQRAPAQRTRNAASRGGAAASAANAQTPDDLLALLSQQARFVPVMDNSGKLKGVALLNVMPDSEVERLGLQSDDVVTSIQGVQVDSSGAALQAAHGIDPAQPVTLGILRHGNPTTVVVNLQHH